MSLAGHSYQGVVGKGTKRATGLGFPTVNVPLPGSEVEGVFAARVIAGKGTYHAAAFADPSRRVLEAHILDFSGDLYRQKVTIELCEKIRDAKMFNDDAALRAAITDDVEKVREYFKNN